MTIARLAEQIAALDKQGRAELKSAVLVLDRVLGNKKRKRRTKKKAVKKTAKKVTRKKRASKKTTETAPASE